MKKRRKKLIPFLIFFGTLIFILFLILLPNKPSNTEVSDNLSNFSLSINSSVSANLSFEEGQKLTMVFVDQKNNCLLDGEVYLNEQFLGETVGGEYSLTKKEYDEILDTSSPIYGEDLNQIKIKGITGECYGEDSNLPFVEYWEIYESDFSYEGKIDFVSEVNPRNPVYYEAMQGFIRPAEAKSKVESLTLNPNETLRNNVETIFKKYYLGYKSERGEYWRTPLETINNKGGDCEDWAILFLSLIKAYDESSLCYLFLWPDHMSVLCNFEQSFIIFDQGKTETSFVIDKNPSKKSIITQENKIASRRWLGDYIDNYGLESSLDYYPHAIIGDKIVSFENKEDFISWVVSKE